MVLSQETLLISLYPPSRLPPCHPPPPIGGGTGGRGRQTPRFEGGPPPQCLTFIWINTFDQFHPPGKISFRPLCPAFPLPSILRRPSCPFLPRPLPSFSLPPSILPACHPSPSRPPFSAAPSRPFLPRPLPDRICHLVSTTGPNLTPPPKKSFQGGGGVATPPPWIRH